MLKLIRVFLFTLFISITFISCGSTKLQTNAKLTKTVDLKKDAAVKKTIYIKVASIYDSNYKERIKLSEKIENALIQKGYISVLKPEDASYELFVNILFANNIKKALELKNKLDNGIVGGSNVVAMNATNTDNLAVGIAMVLTGSIIGDAYQDSVYRSVVDISIKEYYKNNFEKKHEYKTRSFIEASKIDLKEDEALRILQSKLTRQISNLF